MIVINPLLTGCQSDPEAGQHIECGCQGELYEAPGIFCQRASRRFEGEIHHEGGHGSERKRVWGSQLMLRNNTQLYN